jgi:hypothetical protein
MKLTRVLLMGIVVLSGLSACASLPGVLAGQGQVAAPLPGELEPIRAAAVVNDLAVFWVTSNGCTTREDLLPVVATRGAASTVMLRRITQDQCAHPSDDGLEVRWSFEELGLKPGSQVTIESPYQLSPSTS